jgi:hypothetical protein
MGRPRMAVPVVIAGTIAASPGAVAVAGATLR